MSTLFFQFGLRMKSMKSLMSTGDENLKAYETQMYTEVGFYKGNQVALKRFKKSDIHLDRQDFLELKVVSLTGLLSNKKISVWNYVNSQQNKKILMQMQ